MYPCNAGIRPNVAVDKSFRSNRDSCSDGNRRGYRHQESSVKLGEGGKLQRSKFWTLARIGFVSNSFTASLDFFFFKILISSKNKGYRATRDLQDLYTLPSISTDRFSVKKKSIRYVSLADFHGREIRSANGFPPDNEKSRLTSGSSERLP